MRPEDLYRAIGEIGDDLISAAEAYASENAPQNIISIEEKLAERRGAAAEGAEPPEAGHSGTDMPARPAASGTDDGKPEAAKPVDTTLAAATQTDTKRKVPRAPQSAEARPVHGKAVSSKSASSGQAPGKKTAGRPERAERSEAERRLDRRWRVQHGIAAACACLVLGTAGWFGWHATHLPTAQAPAPTGPSGKTKSASIEMLLESSSQAPAPGTYAAAEESSSGFSLPPSSLPAKEPETIAVAGSGRVIDQAPAESKEAESNPMLLASGAGEEAAAQAEGTGVPAEAAGKANDPSGDMPGTDGGAGAPEAGSGNPAAASGEAAAAQSTSGPAQDISGTGEEIVPGDSTATPSETAAGEDTERQEETGGAEETGTQEETTSRDQTAMAETGDENAVVFKREGRVAGVSRSPEIINITDSLAGSEGAAVLLDPEKENPAYSPLNLSIALAMLAESCQGESRQQILDRLDVKDLETLRSLAEAALKKASYDGEEGSSLPANSLWLRDDGTEYSQAVLEILKDSFGASSYIGKMGSKALNEAFRDWLNESTRGLLKDQAEKASLKEETLIALASAIYYHADWSDAFSEYATAPGTFHGKDGDTETAMMRETTRTDYFRGEHFGAISLSLRDGNRFWIFLPDEDAGLSELQEDKDLLRILRGEEVPAAAGARVRICIPKFDAVSETDLTGALKELGITEVLSPGKADFTPLFGWSGDAALSKADHAVRIKVDEYGLTAAAYTVFSVNKTAMVIEDPMEFTCDRPFLYVVADDKGLVWFEGIVNDP